MSNEIIKARPVDSTDYARFVELLEEAGGNLNKFVRVMPDHDRTHEFLIAKIERGLFEHDDKSLHRRWNAAIKSNMVVRLRMLQNASLERIELLSQSETGWLVMAKEIQAHRTLMGDILAGQIHSSKQKPEVVHDSDDEDDSEEAARLRAEA